jgi:hypothetical protein
LSFAFAFGLCRTSCSRPRTTAGWRMRRGCRRRWRAHTRSPPRMRNSEHAQRAPSSTCSALAPSPPACVVVLNRAATRARCSSRVASAAAAASRSRTVSSTAKEKLRNRNVRVGHGATEWSLNDGQIPNPNGVRVAPGTGYRRVEGNRRASRNGRVSDLPPQILQSRFATFFIAAQGARGVHGDGGRGAARAARAARGDALLNFKDPSNPCEFKGPC